MRERREGGREGMRTERYTGDRLTVKMRVQEGRVKGYQGMDEKPAKETDDGRK